MKYTFAAAALVAVASAQSLSDIPTCAISCVDDARTSATSCSKEDYACICKSQEALTAAASGCVLKDCGAEKALNEVLPAVKAFCEKVAEAPAPTKAEPTTKAESTTQAASTTQAEPTTKAESSYEAKPTTKAESSYEVKPTPEVSSSFSVVTSVSLTTSVTGSMTTAGPATTEAASGTYPASHSGPHATTSVTESSPIATAGAAHFGIAGAGVLAALAAFL